MRFSWARQSNDVAPRVDASREVGDRRADSQSSAGAGCGQAGAGQSRGEVVQIGLRTSMRKGRMSVASICVLFMVPR